MHRRHQSYWNRFSQPDPSDGSYNATDPQSFNRYAYVQNDPVNSVDPSGLDDVPGPIIPPPVIIPISFDSPIWNLLPGMLASLTAGIRRIPAISEYERRFGGAEAPEPQNPAPNPVTQGIDQARQALQENSLCRALFGGTNPLTLLNTYSSNNLITSGSSYPVARSRGGTRNERFSSADVGAATSYAAGSYPSPTAAGVMISANPITINQNGFFFSGRDSRGVAVNTLRDRGFYGLSLGQVRGAVIIHDLLHVVSRIPSDGSNPRQSQRNSELVRRFCFPNRPLTTTTTPLATLP